MVFKVVHSEGKSVVLLLQNKKEYKNAYFQIPPPITKTKYGAGMGENENL